jgi:hypothetical protein
MKTEWTKRRTKIEAWQRNSSAEIVKIDLDAIRSKFELERERLGKTLSEFSAGMIVFCDDSNFTLLADTLLTPAQWTFLSH